MREANLDGLPGPTHNYAGLAVGNEASQANAGSASNPKAAVLQGLRKMQMLHDLGISQMVMPPQPRPDARLLHRLGFRGSLKQQMEQAARSAPELLPHLYSSAGMWAANAATVSPGADAADGKLHFTPANMASTPHRAGEAEFVSRVLKRLFPGPRFKHHEKLPSNALFADEGAANHMRLQIGGRGLHVFVYGRDGAMPMQYTKRYPARHSRMASEAVARLHTLPPEGMVFLRQNEEAIDAGAFHNDVVATSNDHFLLYHAKAFADEKSVEALRGNEVTAYRVEEKELSLADAVSTYLFNSQIVTSSSGMVMIAPAECRENARAGIVIERLKADSPINEVYYLDLRESMMNGGGPACLRLRVPMTTAEWSQAHSGAVFTPALDKALTAWAEKYYRDRLLPEDLRDPLLAEEAQAALHALEEILNLPGLYET